MASRKTNKPAVLDDYHGESAAGTEFRRLLHNMLQSSKLAEGAKTFLITSATTGEGKSTIASNLAVTATIYKARKTLLVDADLRRPVLHEMFGFSRENGLTDVLDDKVKLEDAYKSTKLESLWVLSAGGRRSNPSKYFESAKLKEIVEASKFYFDLIIFDSAPVIPVADALSLGRLVDGVVMVLKAGETPREVAKRATEVIYDAGANLLGIAMNNESEALPYYFNQRYYGYNYTSNSN